MGWNSWNQFACEGLNETVVKETVDAILRLGLHRLGYTYVNLDDCWQAPHRDMATGNIMADPNKFPSGMPALASYIHRHQLQFGLYSDAGRYTCAQRPGSLGYELRDVQQYTAWQVDYLKYDNCYNLGLPVQWRYQRMAHALQQQQQHPNNHTTTPILFSLCSWGQGEPAKGWARAMGGQTWRTTKDIEPTWTSIMHNLDTNNQWHVYAGPGGFNDPDMLEVGHAQLSWIEQRSHFTLWCLIKAPLLLGNDIRRTMSPETLSIITNTEVIAWNQDVLGIQGYKRYPPQKNVRTTAALQQQQDGEVWAGELSRNRTAVVLLNRSSVRAINITVDWRQVGWQGRSGRAHVRDVWLHKDLGVYPNSYTAWVEPHDVVALTLSPVRRSSPTYE